MYLLGSGVTQGVHLARARAPGVQVWGSPCGALFTGWDD